MYPLRCGKVRASGIELRIKQADSLELRIFVWFLSLNCSQLNSQLLKIPQLSTQLYRHCSWNTYKHPHTLSFCLSFSLLCVSAQKSVSVLRPGIFNFLLLFRFISHYLSFSTLAYLFQAFYTHTMIISLKDNQQ